LFIKSALQISATNAALLAAITSISCAFNQIVNKWKIAPELAQQLPLGKVASDPQEANDKALRGDL